MAFAIMRISKINSMSNVSSLESHLERKRETKNADPKRRNENQNFIPLKNFDRGNTMVDRLKNSLPDRVRKNAVLAVEHMLTASPDFFKDKKKEDVYLWAKINVEWMKNRYGESNILTANLHMDETTPHLHVVVVPLINGKLKACELFGSKKLLSDMQTDYANWMQKHQKEIGYLERGILGSKATHQTIKKFYGSLDGHYGLTRPTKKNILDIGYEKRNEEFIDKLIPRISNSQFSLETIKRLKDQVEHKEYDIYGLNLKVDKMQEIIDGLDQKEVYLARQKGREIRQDKEEQKNRDQELAKKAAEKAAMDEVFERALAKARARDWAKEAEEQKRLLQAKQTVSENRPETPLKAPEPKKTDQDITQPPKKRSRGF